MALIVPVAAPAILSFSRSAGMALISMDSASLEHLLRRGDAKVRRQGATPRCDAKVRHMLLRASPAGMAC